MGKEKRLGARLARSYMLLAACVTLLFTAGTGLVLFAQMRAQSEHFAVQDIEIVEGLLAFAPDGRVVVREDYHNHPESKKILDHYIEVRSPAGAVLYRNERLGKFNLGGPPGRGEGVGGYTPRRTTLPDGTPVVLVSRLHAINGRPVLIRLARSEEPVRRALELFFVSAAAVFPLAVFAAILAARRMSHRILAPLKDIAAQAGRITSSRLGERLPVHGTGDEIDQLAEIFNQTLTRLDESFRQLRQFTSDASHELRTPLAAIRAIGEVGLERDGSRQDYRDLVGSMLEEVSRLTRLVDDLLMISRGDAGTIQLNYASVRVLDLVRDAVSLLEPLAEDKDQRLDIEGSRDAVVRGDAMLLRQALINVVHNAIKYSPPKTTTFIRVDRERAGPVTIEVRDAGPGIAPEHTKRIFDRFYRVDSGRSRDAGGSGLGLAISQWAIGAHHGSISVSSVPGDGATFRITLPAA